MRTIPTLLALKARDTAELAPAYTRVERFTRPTISRSVGIGVFSSASRPREFHSSPVRCESSSPPQESNSRPGKSTTDEKSLEKKKGTSIFSAIQELLLGHAPQRVEKGEDIPAPERLVVSLEPVIRKYNHASVRSQSANWRKRSWLTHNLSANPPEGNIIFEPRHKKALRPDYPAFFKQLILPNFVSRHKMRSYVQFLTTPTADTPGTTLLLHFDNKRYLIGSLAEGTQRACVQMGTRLLKVTECFMTGRTEWKNTGGLIGMILTLADTSSSSQASSVEEALKRVRKKARKLGIQDDPEKIRQLEDEARKHAYSSLKIFGPPNLNHTVATARRYVFRKGMPLNIHEIRDGHAKHLTNEQDEWAPFWADEHIKVWAMSVSPSSEQASKSDGTPVSVSPRKRSIDEVDDAEDSLRQTPHGEELTLEDRDYLTVKAVVSEMFESSWRLDTLYETTLSQVELPASLFIRNPETNKIEKYKGPLPGYGPIAPDPNLAVLVRRPWPGALVDSLPPVKPAKEAISYIIRNHVQRGKFHPERAKALKVKSGPAFAKLAKGESVLNMNGQTIMPNMVLDPSKVGGGIAVVDLPALEYIEGLTGRLEWREPKVMEGVGAIIWICGKGVATDPRLRAFMDEFKHLEHVVSSPDYCPNRIAFDSVAASTVRLRQVDPVRFSVPVHDAETPEGLQEYGGTGECQKMLLDYPLPDGVHVAARGQVVQLEPAFEIHSRDAVLPLKIHETAIGVPQGVIDEANKAQQATKAPDEETNEWLGTLPPGAKDAEIITLGTGSALPSKYRNVSATLLRVPGWGNLLFDCGENTLGQLKRVFTAEEMKDVLRNLRAIFISHMHADHQLGTTSVIKAWYEEVHNSEPVHFASPSTFDAVPDFESLFKNNDRLAIVAEPAMQNWLEEYAGLEDYGYSRIAPLSPQNNGPDSSIVWYIPPRELQDSTEEVTRFDRIKRNYVQPSLLNLAEIQAVYVKHCHGARAFSITWPSGFKVSYSGDCRPSRDFGRIGKGSTVCIHEATFDDHLKGDAEAKNHSTTSEALGVAQSMDARACVLTHFSQRYQKLPVMERAEGEDLSMPSDTIVDMPPEDNAEQDLDDAENGPLDAGAGFAATFPDQVTSSGGKQYDLPSSSSSAKTEPFHPLLASQDSSGPDVVKFRVKSDMKVCVAFDYMRVKVGDIAQLEKFTPALLKLFAEEDEEEGVEAKAEAEVALEGKKNNGKGKKGS